MRRPNGAFSLVDMLPTRTRCTHGMVSDVARVKRRAIYAFPQQIYADKPVAALVSGSTAVWSIQLSVDAMMSTFVIVIFQPHRE